MSQQVIGIGTTPNDKTGDPARTAFQKTNANFQELYSNYSETVFAGSSAFIGTTEARITAAIAAAVAGGFTYVLVPQSMLPYNTALVTFNAGVQVIREGGNPSVYDVLAYGAAADGVTDDTAAIQATLTAAGGVGEVVIPAGKIAAVGTGLTYPEGTFIRAMGSTKAARGTLKWTGAAAGVLLAPILPNQSNEALRMQDIEIDGNGLLNIGVDLHHVSHSRLQDCFIHDCSNGANACGVRLYRDHDAGYACYYNRIVGGKISTCTIGIFITGTGASSQNNCANSNRAEYVDLLANGTSVYQERGNDFLVLGCASEAPTAIHFRAAGSGFHVIANRVENAGGTQTLPGIQLDSTSDTALEVGNYWSSFTNDPVVDNGSSGDHILRFSTFGTGVAGGGQGYAQATILGVNALFSSMGKVLLDVNGGDRTGTAGRVRVGRSQPIDASGNIMEWYPGTASKVAAVDQYGRASILAPVSKVTTARVANGVVDATTAGVIITTLTAGDTVPAPTGMVTGQRLVMTFIQDSAGGHTVTFNAVFKVSWADTGNTANKRSSVAVIYDGANWNQDGAQSPYV